MRMVRRFQTLQVGSSDKKGENQVHKSHVSDCLRSKRRYEEREKKWVNIVLIRPKKTSSAQTNTASKLKRLERCGYAHSKADETSYIFFF